MCNNTSCTEHVTDINYFYSSLYYQYDLDIKK